MTAAQDLSPTKRALLEIRQLKAQLAQLQAADEPVAIVGLSIRVPGGVVDADSFARLLWDGVDAIGDIPAERWKLDDWYDADPQAPGKMTTRMGGFVADVDRFDAEFFGISPREAASMDPQQRLALELAWEALEDAGVAPIAWPAAAPACTSASRTPTTVARCSRKPRAHRSVLQPGQCLQRRLGSHRLCAGAARAGRVARHGVLVVAGRSAPGLPGPAPGRLRRRAGRRGEPDPHARDQRQFLQGRHDGCRRPLQDVRCGGRRVCARRRRRDAACCAACATRRPTATASWPWCAAARSTRTDAATGSPRPTARPRRPCCARRLRAAGVSAHDVGYVEAHGTGTSLGDPIEVERAGRRCWAMGATPSQPLAIGSVKTNIGHLEAAAGLAGWSRSCWRCSGARSRRTCI